jgi:hypothetical protein
MRLSGAGALCFRVILNRCRYLFRFETSQSSAGPVLLSARAAPWSQPRVGPAFLPRDEAEGGGAPRGVQPSPRLSRHGAHRIADAPASRRSTAVLATSRWLNSGPALPGTRHSRQSLVQRSSSRPARSGRRAGSRSRPSAGLRDLPAGAASHPAVTTPHESALGGWDAGDLGDNRNIVKMWAWGASPEFAAPARRPTAAACNCPLVQ